MDSQQSPIRNPSKSVKAPTHAGISHSVPNQGPIVNVPPLPTMADANDASFDYQAFTQNPFSPPINLSPWATSLSLETNLPQYATDLASNGHDHNHKQNHSNMLSLGPPDQITPGARSANGSALSDADKDPFMSLLEQLAENEHSQLGGPSDLDFYLGEQG